MFALSIELLTGRYVATAYSDRRHGEWPPHPARVFSALVATAHEVEAVDPEERAALLWLESQNPPEIAASAAAERETVTVFVPVNDTTVLGDVEALAAASVAAKEAVGVAQEVERTAAVGRAQAAATKATAKAKATLDKADARLRASLILGDEPTKNELRAAPGLFAERRVRQPRTFPAVTPETPVVALLWPASEPAPEVRAALSRLAERVVRIGHSSSLVRCAVTDTPPAPTWFPDDDGTDVLRVTSSGQLLRLDDEFARHRATEPRVLPCVFQRYRHGVRAVSEAVPQSVFSDDWIVLRRVSGARLPSVRAVELATAVRGALMKYAEQPPPEMITGHGAGGGPSERPHVAIVPLPFVGADHADGSILGVAVVLPRDVTEADRRAVVRAIGTWEATTRVDGEPTPALRVTLKAGVTVELERVVGETLRNLQSRTWCAPSRTWVSTTPIALDKNPGQLRSKGTDPARRAEAESRAAAEACAVIVTSCARVGLPEPSGVTVLPSVSLVGTSKAVQFPAFPAAAEKVRRVKVHAVLTFAEKVAGPVLLGAGRYLGLGLFRPVQESHVQAGD